MKIELAALSDSRVSRRVRGVAGLAMAVFGTACSSGNAAAHVRRGDEYAGRQRYAEARIEYGAALQKDPKLATARLKLGDTCMQLDDVRCALGEYVRAADLLPKSVEAQLKAGRLLFIAGRLQDAQMRADRAVALDPKSADAQILRGNILAGLKDFDAAIKEFQEALAADPTQVVAYDNIAALQLAKGKGPDAEAAFKAAVAGAPSSMEARIALANFYWSFGRPTDAESTLRTALELDPKSPAVNRALGLILLMTGRVADAEPYFVQLARGAHTSAATISLVDYYLAAKRLEDARRLLQPLVSDDAQFAPANLRLASIDMAEGQRAKAQERLHAVMEKQPKNAAALILSARISLAEGKGPEAKDAASRVIASEQNSLAAASAWQIIAIVETANGRIDQAIEAYQNMLKIQPRSFSAGLALAKLHLRRRDAPHAALFAQQALASQPNRPEAIDVLVRADVLAGDAAKAAQDLAPLQKALPNSIGVAKLSALVQLASKEPDQARTTYLRVLTQDPGDLEALDALLTIDITSGRPKDAVTRLDARVKQGHPTVDLLSIAARAHAAVGDWDGAKSLLENAISLDPNRLQTYNLLGGLEVREHRLDGAIERYREVVARNPKAIGAATMIGILRDQQGRVAEAEHQYEQVLQMDPRAAVAANNLAWIYASSNRKLDEALQLAQTALEVLPDDPTIDDTLGWVFYRKNMFAQSIQYLEASVRADPSVAVRQFHLGMAYKQYGAFQKARTTLKRALSLKSDFDGAEEARKTLASIGE